ncbi:FG-GAP-like repeat-containing protein [Nocardioides sp. MAHUQ-72]|uniref:FG-GAP-like repeat-containing protein n=1 Tax=unclassified Nocardioides TaxID=2615069 RepID=UPI00360DA131
MPPSKTRFVTACQQILALGVVLAALTPAASVVTLDVVRESPTGPADAVSRGPAAAEFAAYTRAQTRRSVVPTQVVDPTVTEYSLTAPPGARVDAGQLQARTRVGAVPGSSELTSRPQAVVGYGAVGVTWEHGVDVPESDLSFEVRTRTGEEWSDWMKLAYDADHGPDPGSAEARHARPGTDALLVGDVDQVQVRAESAHGPMPADMKMAVVDPGKAAHSEAEAPALDTGTMDGSAPAAPGAATPEAAAAQSAVTSDDDSTDALDLQAAVYTPKPVIYSRAQWGADESLRDKSSLHYFEVHAGFVHHTVNANDYTRAEVPGIIRSIYAYHTRSRGWSDIGYNYLVDRFGRIWEGRYGGIDRPVVGAHTLGYNDYSFAMSAIGNYDIHQPSQAMVQAYGALFAWKLSLHGVDASSTSQQVGPSTFQAINGHRDAGQTACPGRYLYAKVPRIRELATAAQRGWSGRELESDLASTSYPDLVVRRASDGRAVILPTGGMTRFQQPARLSLPGGDSLVASPDLTGDDKGDLVALAADGTSRVLPGDGTGGFGAPVQASSQLVGRDLVTAVGDLDGDGHNDLVARRASDGRLELYRGTGNGAFRRQVLAEGWSGYDALVATGDVDGDGHDDLLARDDDGRLWRVPGTGGTGLGKPVQLPGAWGKYATLTGFGDFNADGRPDLVVGKKGQPAMVRPARADGSFGHPLGEVTRVATATDVTAVDLTGDSAPDLVARTAAGPVLLVNAGTVELGRPIVTDASLRRADLVLNAGDWNRDGHGDIILRTRAHGNLKLRPGDGEGHFGKAVTIGTGFGDVGLLAAVGDMTGDGWPDLMGQPRGGAIRIYPGNGVDGLRASYVAHGSIDAGSQVAVGRWNRDGAPDSLFRQGSKLTLFPGNGPGGLTSPTSLGLDLSPYDWVVGVSDVGLTGHPDLIVRAKRTGYLWLIPGTAKGFSPRRFLGEGMGAYDLAG